MVSLSESEICERITTALSDAKAENTLAIPLKGKSTLADFLVITTGRSNRHVAAIADHLLKLFADLGLRKPKIEGLPQADWVVVDSADVIVHIFRPEVRAFYNLEKMWNTNAPTETVTETVTE